MTPPPGWAAAPHRYSPFTGVRYCAQPAAGRRKNIDDSDIAPWKMLPPVSQYNRSRSNGESTCRCSTDRLKFGAYSLSTSKQRSANCSFTWSQFPSRNLVGAYWTNIDTMCWPGGAMLSSALVGMVTSRTGDDDGLPYLAST